MLFQIVTAPFTAPMSGFKFILKTIVDMAEKELYDMDRIREDLLLLQLRLEEGQIREEQYLVEEAEVMVKLREARAYNEAKAKAQAQEQE